MGKVKIQFAISDDLKNNVQIFNNEVSNLKKNIDIINKVTQDLKSGISNASKAQSTYGKITTIAENKAKELGIPAVSIPGYSDALKAYDVLNGAIDNANQYL